MQGSATTHEAARRREHAPPTTKGIILTYPQQYAPQQGYPYAPPQQMPPNPSPYPAGAAPQFTDPGQVPQPAPAPALGFQDPTGGVLAPSARHLEGRTIIIRPRRVDESTKYQGQERPTAYLDLYVIDGGPMIFGDSEDRANPRPPTHRIETPAYFENIMIGNTAFVQECRAKLGPDGRPTGLALGVVQRGTRGQRPWMITRCEKDLDGNERPDAAQRKALAQSIYSRHNGAEQPAWVPPKAVPLAAAIGSGALQVNYAQAATPMQAAQMASQHLDQMVNQQYGPPQQQGWPTHPAPAPQPAASSGIPPAPGWAPEQWAQFNPEQQQQIWQSVNAGGSAPASAPPAASQGQPVATPPPPAGPGW